MKFFFLGSIVAMPHIVGWDDVAKTVIFLSENGALSIRIFLPGFSKKTRKELQFDKSIMQKELLSFY